MKPKPCPFCINDTPPVTPGRVWRQVGSQQVTTTLCPVCGGLGHLLPQVQHPPAPQYHPPDRRPFARHILPLLVGAPVPTH